MALPPFFRGISGERTNGKQGKCSHTCYFCIPAGCKNACWGASPNPALGHFVPKQFVCVTVRYRSCSFLRWPSVTPSRWSMLALTATACRISSCAERYSV